MESRELDALSNFEASPLTTGTSRHCPLAARFLLPRRWKVADRVTMVSSEQEGIETAHLGGVVTGPLLLDLHLSRPSGFVIRWRRTILAALRCPKIPLPE